jgi:hypothetical protein
MGQRPLGCLHTRKKKRTMQTYEIVIYPVGRAAPGLSEEVWAAVLYGERPIYAATACALLDLGALLTATFRMRHPGSATVSTDVIGALVKLTIAEDDGRVLRWQSRGRQLLAAERHFLALAR